MENIKLKLDGEVLEDDSKKLSDLRPDYNGSTIKFSFKNKMKILAKDFRGDKVFELEVARDDLVGVVHMMVADKLGVRPEHLTLKFNGNHLSDINLFLYEAGLTDGCTVMFQQRLAHEGQQNFNQPESSEPQNDFNKHNFEKRF